MKIVCCEVIRENLRNTNDEYSVDAYIKSQIGVTAVCINYILLI